MGQQYALRDAARDGSVAPEAAIHWTFGRVARVAAKGAPGQLTKQASLSLAESPGVVDCFRQQPFAEAANLRDLRRRLRTDDPIGAGRPPRQVERPDDAPADQVPGRKSGAGERDPLAVDCGMPPRRG